MLGKVTFFCLQSVIFLYRIRVLASMKNVRFLLL